VIVAEKCRVQQLGVVSLSLSFSLMSDVSFVMERRNRRLSREVNRDVPNVGFSEEMVACSRYVFRFLAGEELKFEVLSSNAFC
jgi:hypothetical protein